jgi:hypothetical protein
LVNRADGPRHEIGEHTTTTPSRKPSPWRSLASLIDKQRYLINKKQGEGDKQILTGQRARRINGRVQRGLWRADSVNTSCHPAKCKLVNI